MTDQVAKRLVAKNLGVRAGDTWLIRHVDVEVAPGEVVVVLGPNGAGKSTLLKALAGDLAPDEGEVLLDGKAVGDHSLDALAEHRAVILAPRRVAFDYTVLDVVGMGWRYGSYLDHAAAPAAMDDVLEVAGLKPLASRIYRTLSSGERQRVQFARGLLQVWRSDHDTRPRWLLLDEPTSNLDARHALEVLRTLRARAQDGLGVFVVVHDLDLGARFADRVVLLCDGAQVAAGAPADVMTSEQLSSIYQTPVHVEHNSAMDRLTVLT